MEKIKDFFYEKSDLFFAGLVVVIVVAVMMRNLGGWMNVEAEDSKYNEIQSTISQDPADDADGDSDADVPDETEDPDPAGDATGDENTSTEEPTKNEAPQDEPSQAPLEEPVTPPVQTEQPSQTPASGQSRNITVAPGSSAKSIADALKAQGLIGDANAFVQALVNSGNDTKLKAGTFTIPEGAGTDQIIAILTK